MGADKMAKNGQNVQTRGLPETKKSENFLSKALPLS